MVILSIKVVRKDSDFELLNQHHETKMNKLAKMRKPGIASGQKSLGAIDQTPRPTLSPIWISMLIVNVDFFCRPHCPTPCRPPYPPPCRPPCLAIFFFVGQLVFIHISHHNVISTICEDFEAVRMEIRKSHGRAYGQRTYQSRC